MGWRFAATVALLATAACHIDEHALGESVTPPDGGRRDAGGCIPGYVDLDGDPANGCECVLSTPSDEQCNGVDDDCDGDTDEGVVRGCRGGIGACTGGTETCADGEWGACVGAGAPSEETCDGELDQDCDGSVDEGCACTAGATERCGPTEGACEAGTQSCVDGVWTACEGAVGPTDEICNGLDDDCDGVVDMNTRPCGTDEGVCRMGTQTCIEGEFETECVGGVAPGTEICDAGPLDEDCDGEANEGCACVTGSSRPCGTDTGICSVGREMCVAGAWSGMCMGGVRPGPRELCDVRGRDDDCDGMTDEGCMCFGTEREPCGTDVGVCTRGERTCASGSWGSCVGGTPPGTEVCDELELDEDCDGEANEGCECMAGDSEPCSLGPTCPGGRRFCESGRWGLCRSLAMPETCNAIDDDCDGTIDEAPADCAADTGCTVAMRPDGHTYLFCTTSRNWFGARAWCDMFDYHLAVIDDMAEQMFVQSESLALTPDEWWIGLRDADDDGMYEDDEWDGGLRSSFRYWLPGDPDHDNQCARIENGSDGGRWNDKNCNDSRAFVCEAP